MFKRLEGAQGSVMAVEISGAYTKDDVAGLERALEAVLAQGHAKVNLLVKLDQLDLAKSEFKALVEDARFALRHRAEIGRIAVVGHSKLEKALVELDNKIFGNPATGLEEKYFDLADISGAWSFVRG